MIYTHTHSPTHTHTHSHVVLFMFPILPLTHMASTYHEVHTHIKTERRCLVFIVYASPFHSFMDVALSCPLFKLVGLVIHIKFGRVSFSHTLIVLPFGSLFFIHSMYQLALSFFFFNTDLTLEICFSEMKRCITEVHGSYVIVNREIMLQSCHTAEVSLSKTLNSHQASDCYTLQSWPTPDLQAAASDPLTN